MNIVAVVGVCALLVDKSEDGDDFHNRLAIWMLQQILKMLAFVMKAHESVSQVKSETQLPGNRRCTTNCKLENYT